MTLENSLITNPILVEHQASAVDESESLLEWQERDSCAPALGKYVFNMAKINSEMTQSDIKAVIYDPIWDGSRPHDITEFYTWYFKDVRCEENVDFKKVKEELDKENFVQVLWHDDLPEEKPCDIPESEWGHWTAIKGINLEEGYVVIGDPSNAERSYDQEGFVTLDLIPETKYKFEKRKTYKMSLNDFADRWHDNVDESGRDAKRLAIFVNPKDLRTDSVL